MLLAGGSLAVAMCLWSRPISGTRTKVESKKGVLIGHAFHDSWEYRLAALNASWFYTWGPTLYETPLAEFVPMIWGHSGAEDEVILSALRSQGQRRQVIHLLGFNEPDLETYADLSPNASPRAVAGVAIDRASAR